MWRQFIDNIDNWWVSIQSKKISTVSIEINQKFVALFDVIYGKRVLSWRRVIASYISSILAVFSLALIVGWENTIMDRIVVTDDLNWTIVFIIFLFNPVIDFISLAETRWVLRYMAKAKNNWLVTLYFLTDVFLTTTVMLISIFLFLILYTSAINNGFFVFILVTTPIAISLLTSIDSWGLFTMSTYFTSFFVVLFTVAAFLAKLSHSLFSFTPRFFYLIQATNRPYQVVAGGISIVVVVFYLIFYFLNLNLYS